MSEPDLDTIIASDEQVVEVVRRAREAEFVAVDLEFVSESRYVPELALIQLGFPSGADVEVAGVDPLAASIDPILELLSDPDICFVAHAAKQDLSLLAYRYGLEAKGLMDTQIAAAFAGMGEQIGYGKLVAKTLGVTLDKGAQWTDWLERPLSDKQVRYALDDVRYLCPAWQSLKKQLGQQGRLGWVKEESDNLCLSVAKRREPEDVYKTIGGGNSLKGPQLGAFRELAAWREREALAKNKPPSWILTDSAMVDVARRKVKKERDLKRVRGIGEGTVSKYGGAIMVALQKGAETPISEKNRPPAQLTAEGQARAFVVLGLVHARAIELGLPPRFLGSRGGVEHLVRFSEGNAERADVGLLNGWRAELVGDDAVALLEGTANLSLRADVAGGMVVTTQ